MRDIFTGMFVQEPIDPIEAARRATHTQLKRRFYRDVAVGENGASAFVVILDDRGVRTPKGAPLVLPTRALADAIAAEWRRQAEFIDPTDMPLTRLANTIVEGVEKACASVAADVVKYIRSDLLFYRAQGPAGLIARQAAHWDPILDWVRDGHGARFMLAEGVTYVEQPEGAVAAVAALIPSDAWRLGALHALTTLTGSALIALALAAGKLSPEAAWAAANVDEDWNMQIWGRDEPALKRRAFREAEMRAAAMVLASLAGEAG